NPCVGVREAINGPVTTANNTNFILAYPNPFNGSTTISYSLATDEKVNIKVYSVSGGEVATLQNGRQLAGLHNLEWNGSAFPGGVYIIKMEAGKYTGINKLMLMK